MFQVCVWKQILENSPNFSPKKHTKNQLTAITRVMWGSRYFDFCNVWYIFVSWSLRLLRPPRNIPGFMFCCLLALVTLFAFFSLWQVLIKEDWYMLTSGKTFVLSQDHSQFCLILDPFRFQYRKEPDKAHFIHIRSSEEAHKRILMFHSGVTYVTSMVYFWIFLSLDIFLTT